MGYLKGLGQYKKGGLEGVYFFYYFSRPAGYSRGGECLERNCSIWVRLSKSFVNVPDPPRAL